MNARILLVEDDDAIADALRLHLEPAGLHLRREPDGRGARSALAEPWDLLLLDLMLPDIDGWDLCRIVRERQPALPVIMLSARATEAHRVLGLEIGADDYLAKPFSMLELLARIRSLLRRREQWLAGAGATRELHFGPNARFRLEPVSRRLLDRGAPVPLTLREFDLLFFLARHPGRAFGRDELLQRVWGAGFDGFDHTVNSHINRLRAKLEDNPREPKRIVTVWGVGYRFEVAA